MPGATQPPAPLSLTMPDFHRDNKKIMTERHQSLEASLSSAGLSDFLYERTPDLQTTLNTSRRLKENDAHKLNSTNLKNRAQDEVKFAELCVKIGKELGSKLSDIRTDKALADETFYTWCTRNLNEIGRTANHMSFMNQYSTASLHPTLAPIDQAVITTPLPITGVPDLDYALGGFGETTQQLNAYDQTTLAVSVIHPGIESLARALRMCLNGNVTQSQDPVWGAAIDLINGSGSTNLSNALQEAGELLKAADESLDSIEAENLRVSDAFKNSAFEDGESLLAQKIETKSLIDLEEQLFSSSQIASQKFNNKLEQLM